MRRVLLALGAAALAVLAASFLGPAADYAGARAGAEAAEERAAEAERQAGQAAREWGLSGDAGDRARCEEATARAAALLGESQASRERRAEAWDRLRSRLGRWGGLFGG